MHNNNKMPNNKAPDYNIKNYPPLPKINKGQQAKQHQEKGLQIKESSSFLEEVKVLIQSQMTQMWDFMWQQNQISQMNQMREMTQMPQYMKYPHTKY